MVSGLKAGSVEITARVGGETGVAAIEVHGAVVSLQITPEPAIVDKDRTFQVTATMEDEVGHVLDRPVDWTIDDETIATIDTDGTLTGVELGRAVLTAASEGVSASTAVIVPQPLSGRWLGAGTQDGVTLTLDITFQETADGSLSGPGIIGIPGMSLDNFVITSGVRIRGSVSFTMPSRGSCRFSSPAATRRTTR